MTLATQRIIVAILIGSLAGFVLPARVQAAVSNNLVGSNWNLVGAVEQSSDMITLRETEHERAYTYQSLPVARASGNRLLLISYTAADQLRTGSDPTGLPYLYGYAMNSRGRILSYLQSPSLRHEGTAGSWSVTSSTFPLPRGTTSVRLFLKQASKRGTIKDGRAASFFTPGVFVSDSERELENVIERYRREMIGSASPPSRPSPPSQPSFNILWNGYGTVSLDPSLFLSPKISTGASETHSALVTSRETYGGNYEANFKMTTLAQLRTGSSPNPWEVGWFVFGYKPDGKFKYLILKPNGYGVELGESLLNDRQNFLYTSRVGSESFPVGQTYDVRVRVENNVITLFVGGTERMRYRVSSRDLLPTNGKIGFYSEDAAVRVENISVRAL